MKGIHHFHYFHCFHRQFWVDLQVAVDLVDIGDCHSHLCHEYLILLRDYQMNLKYPKGRLIHLYRKKCNQFTGAFN